MVHMTRVNGGCPRGQGPRRAVLPARRRLPASAAPRGSVHADRVMLARSRGGCSPGAAASCGDIDPWHRVAVSAGRRTRLGTVVQGSRG